MARPSIPAIALAAVALLAGVGQAAGSDGTAPGGRSAAGCRGTDWLAVWGSSPSDADESTTLAGQTIRTIVTPLGAGERMRVRLSNRFGTEPLVIDAAFVGAQSSGPALRPGTNTRLRFGGDRGASIAPGEDLVSDPVSIRVRPFRRLAISLHVAPASSAHPTRHLIALQTTYVAPATAGDLTAAEAGDGFEGSGAERISARPIVTAIDVRAPRSAGAVVAFGDSITDGAQAPGEGVDADARYPDFLARRLLASPVRRALSVVNAGISGNALRAAYIPAFGPSALSRLRRDVIEQPGVTDVIVLLGRNDFGFSEPPQVIAALRTLLARLHRHGLNVLLGTFSPSVPGQLAPPAEAEQTGDRHAVNRWIRRSGLPTRSSTSTARCAIRPTTMPCCRASPAATARTSAPPATARWRAQSTSTRSPDPAAPLASLDPC